MTCHSWAVLSVLLPQAAWHVQPCFWHLVTAPKTLAVAGEYVFDHSWANAAAYSGTRYYPKLQCCVPFSPVTGPRLLTKPGADRAGLQAVLGKALSGIAGALAHFSQHGGVQVPLLIISRAPGLQSHLRQASITRDCPVACA